MERESHTYAYGYYDDSTEDTYTLDFTLSPQGDSITAYQDVVGDDASGTTNGSNTAAGSWACASDLAAQIASLKAQLAAAQSPAPPTPAAIDGALKNQLCSP